MTYNDKYAQKSGMWGFVVTAISFRHMSRHILQTIDVIVPHPQPTSTPSWANKCVPFALHF